MRERTLGGKPPDFTAAYKGGLLDSFFELPAGALDAALRVPRPSERDALVAALKRNVARIGAPEAVMLNIDKLADPRSRVVVTGQQVGLLLGPTYTLSKAATAIALAARLDTPERPVVPLFWLATQDHDSLEIDHTHVLSLSEELTRVQVELPAGVPAGRIPLKRESVDHVRLALKAIAPNPPHLQEVDDLIKETAATGGYADWFAGLLTSFFGEAGLVLVDPLQPDLAELTVGVLKRELEDPLLSSALINEAGKKLKALGYEPQLGRGEDATNLFIELPAANGMSERHLLRRSGGGFVAGGQRFTRADLMSVLDADPTALTPAAGLRPVTQDALLPTGLFVIGPGELKYVAQLKGVYEQHGVPMPLVWRRASVTVIEPAARRLLDGLGVSAARFQRDHQVLLEETLLKRAGHARRFDEAASALGESFDSLLTDALQLDVTLEGTVARGRRHLEATLARLRKKSAQALKARDETTTRQFERLRAHLLPAGRPVERVLNPLSHALKFGLRPLTRAFRGLEPEGDQEVTL